MKNDLRLNLCRKSSVSRERLDVRSHSYFGVVLVASFRIYDEVVVWSKICFRDLRQFFAAGHAVSQHALDCGKRCSFRAYEEYLCIQRAASALEVSVKCTQGNGSGFRGLSHADAWSTCVFDDTCTGVDDVSQRAVLSHLGHDLAGSRGDYQADVRMNLLALQDSSDLHEIHVGGVCAASDRYLIHLDLADVADAVYVVRAVRHCCQRSQLIQVYDQFFVVNGVRICSQRCIVFFSSLFLEVDPCIFITWEYRCRCTQLCAHVGDSRSVGYGKALHTFTRIFDDLAYATLYGQLLEHVQDHVLCRNPWSQCALQFYLDNLRRRQAVSALSHCNCYVQSSCTDGDHAQAAACRSVAVGPQQSLARLAVVFQLELVADAVARLGEQHAVSLGNALDEFVVVGVFEACLQCVVVYVCNGKLSLNFIDFHRFQLQIYHGASGVLCQGLVDLDSDLFARSQGAFHQVVF